jgi:hypothetical protein
MEAQAIIKSMGDLVISLGGYLAVRFLIPDRETVRRTIKVLGAVCVILAACMMREQFTRQSVFEFLGGLPPEFREGHVRSAGTMGSLGSGAFAGSLVPLFLWLWTQRKSRIAACAGFVGATTMVFASHTSTSWLTYGASLVGLGFWRLRKRMRVVRWGLVGILVALHLVMHGPVWSLIEKIDLTGGSSSYHRYALVDNFIRHFGDWWLLGTQSYGDWGFMMFDVCNQFVLTGLRGGLLTLVLYITIYKLCFAAIGKASKRLEGDHEQEWFPWCLGSVLFATIVASFGINYIVQLLLYFFSLLACVSVTALEARKTAARMAESPATRQLASVLGAGGSDLPVNETSEPLHHLFEA